MHRYHKINAGYPQKNKYKHTHILMPQDEHGASAQAMESKTT